MKWDTCYGWTDTWTNILTISTYVWNMSNHMVSVVLYGLTYLSFFKISFRSVSMCPRPYIFVSEITTLPMLFSFSIISYRFRFQWKNVKVKVVEPFADRFLPFSSRSTGCKTARVVCVEDAWSDQNVVRGRLVYNSCSFQISERGEILTRGCRGAPVHWATTACFGCIYLHC